MKSTKIRHDMGHPCLTPLDVLKGSSSEPLIVVVAHKYTEMMRSSNTRGVPARSRALTRSLFEGESNAWKKSTMPTLFGPGLSAMCSSSCRVAEAVVLPFNPPYCHEHIRGVMKTTSMEYIQRATAR